MIYHSGGQDFQGLEHAVRKTCANLREQLDMFDSIIVQGISGQCVGFIVALRLKKPILVLRKAYEDCHDVESSDSPPTLINKHAMGRRVLFLDDFVSNGRTYGRCAEAVKAHGGLLVGIYEYRHHTLVWK